MLKLIWFLTTLFSSITFFLLLIQLKFIDVSQFGKQPAVT